ncbi:MAG: hypothetical protein Q7V57_00940 [Actinomycetota bacterium]|nr:hypothetical protein [Actinomycetota bacterium]
MSRVNFRSLPALATLVGLGIATTLLAISHSRLDWGFLEARVGSAGEWFAGFGAFAVFAWTVGEPTRNRNRDEQARSLQMDNLVRAMRTELDAIISFVDEVAEGTRSSFPAIQLHSMNPLAPFFGDLPAEPCAAVLRVSHRIAGVNALAAQSGGVSETTFKKRADTLRTDTVVAIETLDRYLTG